jgi:ribonuclease HI
MEPILLFTDGSCLDNQKGRKSIGFGGYGGFILYNKETMRKCTYYDELEPDNATNNIGELLGLKLGLELIMKKEMKNSTKRFIHVYTDSKYVIDNYTKHIKKWIDNNWTRTNGGEIKNLEIIQETYYLMQECEHKIIFHHCKAHTTEPRDKSSMEWCIWNGNNQADLLANRGSYAAKERYEEEHKKDTSVRKTREPEPEKKHFKVEKKHSTKKKDASDDELERRTRKKKKGTK